MAKLLRTTLLFLVFLFALSIAQAQKGSLNLSCFPAISVADGHTTVTITAEVRDLDGSFVRNGTPVIFETDKGVFRGRNVVETQNGFARVVLTAPGVPGTAKIRANVFSLNASAIFEIDFVNDRSVLDSAKEFIEVTSPDSLRYATQDRVMEAAAENRGAVLRYRDIEIRAQELQLRVPSYEVRARGAHLTLGKKTFDFKELYIKLNTRRGLGLVAVPRKVPVVRSAGFGASVNLVDQVDLRLKDITSQGEVDHVGEVNLAPFTFTDISNAMSIVEAKKGVVSPGRSVQFQKAVVKLGGQTVMTLPLFQVDLNTSSPIITEQFLNVSNSSLAINYPYYLSLKPGETSLLRFKYGNRYSSGLGATNGTYLDYEYNWNKGAKMEGGLTVSGLARNDWGAGLRQYWQPDQRSQISAQIDVPAHKSLFSNLGYSRQFNGFQTSLSAQYGKNLSGDRFQSDTIGFNLDGDPISLGKLPMNVSIGLTAQSRRIRGLDSDAQQSYGVQTRFDSHTLLIDKRDTLNFSYTLSRLAGSNITSPMTQIGSINVTSNWIPGLYMQTTYEYGQDGFTEDVLGRHRLTMDGIYTVGRFNARSYVSKSLDLDRLTANLNFDYKLDNTWRLSTGYLLDRYAGDTFLEQTFILGYRLGFREIGLSFSTRTKRIGFELLGTRFN